MRFIQLGRREFITLIGSAAAAWPLGARAQKSSLPVVAFLSIRQETAQDNPRFKHINRALAEMGFVEGRNFTYRFADSHLEQLAELAADLVQRNVAVIVTFSLPEALAAKAATASIPVLFGTGADPVANGLVASMNLPGGNLTGVANLNADLIAKRLELLHELVPAVELIGYFTNTTNKAFADEETKALQRAARVLELRLLVFNAGFESDEIAEAFAALARARIGGLIVGADFPFLARRNQFAYLSTHYKMPAIYAYREYVAAGGLVSYGINYLDGYRIMGTYVGRILKGEKPGDLPVQQPAKLELVFNLKTVRSLGLEVSPTLLARADEVIE